MYLESLLNMPNKPEPRFLRRAGADAAEESESIDRETDRVELESLCSMHAVSSWGATASSIRATFGGVRGAGDRSLCWIWSLDVRDGADVTLVDCVSCEWTDMELRWSLSSVVVESARDTSCGGDKNWYGSWMPLSVANSANSPSKPSSVWWAGRLSASKQ
jgi:hypothetical protein